MVASQTDFLTKIIKIQQLFVTADFELESFLNLVVDEIQKLTPATGVVIELIDGEEMVYRAASGTAASFISLRLKKQGSISGLCVTQNKMLISEDTEHDDRVNVEACRHVQARSILVAPLVHREEAVGVLKIFYKEVRKFNDIDIQMVTFMAAFIAAGLSHQLVYKENKELLNQRTRDLEKLKLINEEITRNEFIKSKLAAIIEFTDDAIIGLTPEGYIESWNHGAEELYGYKVEEVIGKSVEFIYPSHKKSELQNILAKIKIGDRVNLVDTERLHKDGRIIPVSVMLSPIKNKSGMIIGYSGITKDNSELKKLMDLKNDLVSIVSHELRTPITAIQGALTLVLANAADKISAEDLKLLHISINNSDRLLRLINNILDVQKIDAGKMDFKFEIVNMKDLIDEAITNNLSFAEKFNRKLSIINNESAPIKANHDRIIQVLTNLISNAVKFSTEKEIFINSTVADQTVKVEIINTGPGIAEEDRSKIFSKFSQLSKSAKIRGTGLGLTISKEIVANHAGHIDFTSEMNGKTVFYFELPLQNHGQPVPHPNH